VDEDTREGGPEAQTWEPPVVLSHIAYFFVPLPEPLGLPDGYVIRIGEDTPGEWYQGGGPPPPPVHLAASLLFHRAQRPSSDADDLSVLFDTAARALPDPDRPDGHAPEETGPDAAATRRDAMPATEMTVVEMAVAFDLPPGRGQADAEADAGGDADGADAEGGFLDAPLQDAVSDAFDRGLQYVRDVQRAYYTVRRKPVRLVAREALPLMVPLGIRRLVDDEGEPLPFRAPLSAFFLHMNVTARDDDLDQEQLDVLSAAMRHQASDGPFASHLDFVREAEVALVRDGAHRAAVLFTATACEVLLDDLLAHMLWQERVRPEDAAAVFDGWLTARVKTQYHPRLGGNWSLDRPGPVAAWSTDVAALRNRVVHGGYEPSLAEARSAADAAQDLNTYACDLVAAKTGDYPRTALVLPGERGLRRRGRWSRRGARRAAHPQHGPWAETFARWRQAMQRARADSPAAVAPSTTDAWTYLVVRSSGDQQWVVHDRTAGMAARLDPARVAGVLPGQREQLDRLVRAQASAPHDDYTIRVAGAAPPPSDSDWVPEYRLVPGAGVMVDGQDLDPA
jgi:hypothetical protein